MNITLKKIFRSARVLGLCATLGACSDFFDPSQDLIQEREDHYQSLDMARKAVVGAYAGLQEVVEPLVVLGGLRGDLMVRTLSVDESLREIENYSVTAKNEYANPRPFYDIILECNDALANLEKTKQDPQMTEHLYPAYKAELMTLRAWTYFQLAQTYKEVPFITQEVNGFFGDYKPESLDFISMINWLTEEMTWAQKQPILDWTVTDKNDKEILQPWRKVFINRKALLGELYLTAGQYQKAANLLYSCIIDDGQGKDNEEHKCAGITGQLNWRKYWHKIKDGSSTFEQISVIPFQSSQGQTNELSRIFSNASYNDYLLKPSSLAVSIWEKQHSTMSNLPGDFYRGLGASYRIYSEDTVITKFSQGSNYKLDPVFSIYRAADVHLLYAEAINRLNQSDKALAVVNSELEGSPETSGIRGRVNLEIVRMDKLKLDYPDITDERELVEIVLLEERALEFAFEGRRWNDLVRFATRVGKPEWLADRVASKFASSDPDRAEKLRAFLMDEDNWRLDMPMVKLENKDQ
ncbi:hypothetical protein FUAX_39440 (plasmid) [Fulvitalea axinellae]|uniref:RagB/SusD domain-containing protein n=1 Tax=Fulvitalea axinellae TaxID=1182444 RepID=A0AAU9D1G3_9BACT|nr:hypothetical protein FUAX_39440 [Fulvitalea axinellae]